MVVDVKQNLRKLTNFSSCVREALNRVEQLCTAQNVGRLQSIKQTDSAMELITEFVFCEIDRGGVRKKRLTCAQELQLLEILCSYFKVPRDDNGVDIGDAARNTVFMSLFPHTNVDRCQILIKLVSTAIATDNIPLLTSTGVLMQQVGCTSKFTVQLAKGIVNDYFVLMPNVIPKLTELPVKAPLFAANFLVAITEIYYNTDDERSFSEPPGLLLELVTYWVSEYPALCSTALVSNLLPALPHGAIPMPAITPFVGLFKWCIFAPLYDNNDFLYSSLHLSILKSLLQTQVQCPVISQRNIISAQSVTALITYYSTILTKVFKTCNSKSFPEKVQTSLERLTQFIQVALSTESIYGNKQELLNKLETLPKIRALQIILKEHQEII